MITFKKIVFAKLVRVVHGWAEVGGGSTAAEIKYRGGSNFTFSRVI